MHDLTPDLTNRERVERLLDDVEAVIGEFRLLPDVSDEEAIAYVAGKAGLRTRQIPKLAALYGDRVTGKRAR